MAPTEQLTAKKFEDLPEDLQKEVFGALMKMREHISMERIEALMPGLLWDVERSRNANAANKMNTEMALSARHQNEYQFALIRTLFAQHLRGSRVN